jgi:hypothetical protein
VIPCLAPKRWAAVPMDARTEDWLDRELAGSSFVDERLGKRLRKLVELMGNAIGSTVPLACQYWANTKAAYRFFSNDRVSEAEILAGHFQSTRDRFAATQGPILVLQDTTEFTFQREHSAPVGITYSVNNGKDKGCRYRLHTVCGLLMHSSLAVPRTACRWASPRSSSGTGRNSRARPP